MDINARAKFELETELYLLEYQVPRDEKKIHAIKVLLMLAESENESKDNNKTAG